MKLHKFGHFLDPSPHCHAFYCCHKTPLPLGRDVIYGRSQVCKKHGSFNFWLIHFKKIMEQKEKDDRLGVLCDLGVPLLPSLRLISIDSKCEFEQIFPSVYLILIDLNRLKMLFGVRLIEVAKR
jgi:hypothetical protein